MAWEALVGNNPDRDFELEMEMWSDGKLRAMIRSTPEGLALQIFPNDQALSIPVEWLLEKLTMAKSDLA